MRRLSGVCSSSHVYMPYWWKTDGRWHLLFDCQAVWRTETEPDGLWLRQTVDPWARDTTHTSQLGHTHTVQAGLSAWLLHSFTCMSTRCVWHHFHASLSPLSTSITHDTLPETIPTKFSSPVLQGSAFNQPWVFPVLLLLRSFSVGDKKMFRYKHLSSSPPSSPVRLPVEGGDVRRLVWSTTDSSPTQQSPRQSLGREGWWQGTRLDMSQREWVASCYWSCLSGAHRSAQGTYSVLDLRVKTFNTLTNSGCFS